MSYIFHTQVCHTLLFHARHLSHTTFATRLLSHTFARYLLCHVYHKQVRHEPFFTHNFATHHLSHTALSHATLAHTASLSDTIFHIRFFVTRKMLPHTIFHILVTCNLLIQRLSCTTVAHTIFVRTHCFTHSFVTRIFGTLIFVTHKFVTTHTTSLSHTVFSTQLCHQLLSHPTPSL